MTTVDLAVTKESRGRHRVISVLVQSPLNSAFAKDQEDPLVAHRKYAPHGLGLSRQGCRLTEFWPGI